MWDDQTRRRAVIAVVVSLALHVIVVGIVIAGRLGPAHDGRQAMTGPHQGQLVVEIVAPPAPAPQMVRSAVLSVALPDELFERRQSLARATISQGVPVPDPPAVPQIARRIAVPQFARWTGAPEVGPPVAPPGPRLGPGIANRTTIPIDILPSPAERRIVRRPRPAAQPAVPDLAARHLAARRAQQRPPLAPPGVVPPLPVREVRSHPVSLTGRPDSRTGAASGVTTPSGVPGVSVGLGVAAASDGGGGSGSGSGGSGSGGGSGAGGGSGGSSSGGSSSGGNSGGSSGSGSSGGSNSGGGGSSGGGSSGGGSGGVGVGVSASVGGVGGVGVGASAGPGGVGAGVGVGVGGVGVGVGVGGGGGGAGSGGDGGAGSAGP